MAVYINDVNEDLRCRQQMRYHPILHSIGSDEVEKVIRSIYLLGEMSIVYLTIFDVP
jgi:hypothetical protein